MENKATVSYERERINEIRLFEAFSGIGAQHQALKNIGANYKVVGISEIDKYALKSYKAIHGDVRNFGDISKIDTEQLKKLNMNLFTYSFPCQDISLAGHQKGLDKGSNTRSSLLWECEKIIKDVRPKVLLMENVKNLVGKKNKPNFEKWLNLLGSYGYTNYWEVLNAKDYGIPQNRERVFVVSILGEHKSYIFPEKTELSKNLSDILEDKVTENFFLNSKQLSKIKFEMKEEKNRHGLVQVGVYQRERRNNPDAYRVFNSNGLSPSLTTMQGGGRQPHVLIKNATKKGYKEATSGDIGVLDGYRVRKLTSLECWRLMGFGDEDFYKAEKVNSNSQLYKQAGNSIVVDVLEEIFKEIIKSIQK